MPKIEHLIFDCDGVLVGKDDYTTIINALHKSSGKDKLYIEKRIGELEREYVLRPSSRQFLADLKNEFAYQGTREELVALLNDRGADPGVLEILPQFKESGLILSILSNQLKYRIPFVEQVIEESFGLENFYRVWISPNIGYQKPFVGISEDDKDSAMDVSKVDIFPYVVIPQLALIGHIPEQTIFIDDSVKNIQTARSNGFNGIVFENVGQMKNELRDYGMVI